MIVVGFWKNIGSVFFLYMLFLYFGLDHRAVVMLSDFQKKSNGVILIEE